MHQQPKEINTEPEMQGTGKRQPLTGVKVLLVEDEFDVAELLQEAGAEVVWIAQATEVVPQLHQHHPDILISNIKLPDHDGVWLIQQVRRAETETCVHLPTIAVTFFEFKIQNSKFKIQNVRE